MLSLLLVMFAFLSVRTTLGFLRVLKGVLFCVLDLLVGSAFDTCRETFLFILIVLYRLGLD